MLNKQEFAVVFLFSNKAEVDFALEESISKQTTDLNLGRICTLLGKEIQICNIIGIEHAILTKETDYNGIEKLIGKTILVRGSVQLVTEFRAKAKDLGVAFLIEGTVQNWPKKIVNSFNKRRVFLTKHSDTLKPENFRFPIFIKTMHLTNLGSTGSKMSFILKDKKDHFNEYVAATMHLPEQFPMIVSDLMNIKTDEFGKKEYRCFISNQNVSSISRYLDNKVDYIVSKEVVNYALDFANSHKHLPSCYVLDIAETDKGIDIVELNDLESSGRYGKNSFDKFLQFIVS